MSLRRRSLILLVLGPLFGTQCIFCHGGGGEQRRSSCREQRRLRAEERGRAPGGK